MALFIMFRSSWRLLKLLLVAVLTALLVSGIAINVSQGFLNDVMYYPIVKPRIALGIYDPKGDFKSATSILLDHHFVTWRLDNTFELDAALQQAKDANRIPLITLEPWAWNWEGMTRETLLWDIVAGKYDATLHQIFLTLKKEAPQKILLRWAHEMEMVDQYPWSKREANDYVAAYHHVVGVARQMEVTNVLWVWSPAGNQEAKYYFPGDAYVDYVGVSIYATKAWNWYETTRLRPFQELMAEKYWVARRYQKPMIVAEVGVDGTDAEQSQWLAQMVTHLNQFPQVRGIVYFNQIQPEIVPLTIGQPNWELKPNSVAQLLQAWDTDKTKIAAKTRADFFGT